MDKVKERILEYLDEIGDNTTKDVFSKVPFGKMLRSRLILEISPNSIDLCAIVELIHFASLLHDDVIDDALTRRGKSTINSIFGNKISIMLGDILYSFAFSKLAHMPKEVITSISLAVKNLSVGELLDVKLTEEFNDSYDKYLDMIYKKTASLIEACSYSAAVLANLDADKFALYGKNIGIAFQMVDDILDIISDSKTLGKPAMSDFKEGKVTIPYLLLYERLNEEDKVYLKSLYKKDLNENELNWIKSNMEKFNVINDSINIAKNLAKEAVDIIKNENIKSLEKIALDMVERKF